MRLKELMVFWRKLQAWKSVKSLFHLHKSVGLYLRQLVGGEDRIEWMHFGCICTPLEKMDNPKLDAF